MRPDGFLIAIALSVAAAFAAPAIGMSHGVLHMGSVTDIGVALVFFLHGAAISPATMRAAVTNWRLHAVIQASTYCLFPVIGLIVWRFGLQWLGSDLALGFFFLCAISSTISSSVAMTALGRGNVAGAIFNATLSGLIGMALTPLLMSAIIADGHSGGQVLGQIEGILGKLLLPFAAGQILRGWIQSVLDRHKALIGKVDRMVIVMIVYTAFCDAAAAGTWTHDNAVALVKVFVLCVVTLAFALIATTVAARWLGLSKEDEIAAVFCGSKKSLANGAPIGKVLFGATPALSLILVPLLLYHQAQLVVCAILARRYAERDSQGKR